jgi:hypothetical protein
MHRPEQLVRLSALGLLLIPALAVSAEPEPLDEAFLDYLAELEDEDDDWTWFAQDDDDEDAAKKPVPETKVKP